VVDGDLPEGIFDGLIEVEVLSIDDAVQPALAEVELAN